MDEDQDGDFTPTERLSMESVLAEIKLRSQDLHDLLEWIGNNDEYDIDEFNVVLGAVYSFARATNPSMEGDTEDGESDPTSSTD